MRSFNKFLILLILAAFLTSGTLAQSEASTKLKNQLEQQVKPLKPDKNVHELGPAEKAPSASDQKIQIVLEDQRDPALAFWPQDRDMSEKSAILYPSPSEELFDLQFSWPVGIGDGEAGIETDDTYIYTTKWNGTDFYKYDLSGNLLETFACGTAGAIRDLAYDGTYFYGAAASTTVFQMDFNTQTVVSTFNAPTNIRGIAYNEDDNLFYGNNWSDDIQVFDPTGASVAVFPAVTPDRSYYGFAYDNYCGGTYLWGYSQLGTVPADQNILIQMELPSGNETGVTFDVATLITPITGIAGGLCISNALYTGTWTIMGIMQNEFIWGLELCTSGPPLTIDVGIQSIVSPESGVNLSNAESVNVIVKNFGTDPQSNFDIWFEVDGGGQVVETITTTLNSGETVEHTFAITVDLSAYGTYEVEVCTDLTGDENPANDCKTKSIENSEPSQSFCMPSYSSGCVVGDGFTDFAVEEIQNLNNGCADNTGFIGWSEYYELGPAILLPGFEYTFTLGTGFVNQYVNIWIDFNDDMQLTPDEMIIQDYNIVDPGVLYDVDITIPANANPGNHKMRAMAVYAATFTDPCGSYSDGEAEDYAIIIGGQQFGNIAGNVLLDDPLPYNIGDVTEVLVSAGNYTANPDASGNYDISVYPSTYDVTASLYGYDIVTVPDITVDEAGTETVDFTLPCIYGIVEGTVTAVTGSVPIENVTVSAVGTGISTTTAADGTYTLFIEHGNYDFKASAPFYSPQTVTLDIVELTTTTQDFSLEDSEGVIVVIDLDPTPNPQIETVIQGFFLEGIVVYTTDINGYPLDEQVQTVFLLLGMFSNNFAITETEAAIITTWIDTYGGNLYMEGSDTWAFDTPTSLHAYFNINGLEDGEADLSNVEGIDSYWSGFYWSYIGENNFIDHLEAVAPAINVAINPDIGYNCAVAYDAGDYKTVGASYEITGLVDGGGSFDMGVATVMGFFGYPVFVYGNLDGIVTDADSGDPIEGATVSVGSWSDETETDGTYLIEDLLGGEWEAVCTKEGYNVAMAPVTILEDQTTTQDFQLSAPEIVVTPLAFEVTMDPNSLQDETANISNPGLGTVDWDGAVVFLDNGGTDDPWDLQFSFDLEVATGALGNAGAECDGQYYYSTRWASNLIHKFDFDGNLIEEFSIPGVSGLRDLAFDGTYMYGGAATNTIFEMDFVNQTLISSISSPQQVRSIAYDEDEDAFWCANWDTDITLVSKAGAVLNSIPAATHALGGMYGSAYDAFTPGGPYLMVFDQGAGAGTAQIIHQVDLSTITMTGFTYDVMNDLGPDATALAGGLFLVDNVYPGLLTIGGLLQGTPDVFFIYELAQAGVLWLSIEPTSGSLTGGTNEDVTLHFNTFDLLPGDYFAEIHFTSDPNVGEPVVDVTLHVEGLVPAINLDMDFDCTDIIATWGMPAGSNPDSWNIYKDGTLLANVTEMTYTDEMVDPTVEYGYYVTAVYAGEESMPTSTETISAPIPGDLEVTDLDGSASGYTAFLDWSETPCCVAPDSYEIYRDGTFVDNTTVTEYTDPDLPQALYEYYVVAVYYFGDSDSSDPVNVLIPSVGIDDLNANAYQIYPNPATDLINVKAPVEMESIKVLNNAGQLVVDEDVNANFYQIDVSQLESGIYYIKLETGDGLLLRKITIR